MFLMTSVSATSKITSNTVSVIHITPHSFGSVNRLNFPATPTNPKIGFIGIEFDYLLNYLKHSVNSECYFIFYSFSAISATRLA